MILILATWAVGIVIGFQPALAVLTATGFAAAVIGLRRPVLGLFGIAILCTLDNVSRAYILTGGLFRFNTFNYWLLFVMLLSLPFLLNLHDVQSRLLELLVLLLVLGLAISADQDAGIEHILNVATSFGLLVYFARCRWSQDERYWIGVVSGTLSGAGGFVYFLQQDSLPPINHNSLAFLPVTGLFAIALAFSAVISPGRRLALTLLATINGVWVFLSGSRGTALTALVCVLYLLRQLWRSGRAVPILGVALLIAAGATSQFSEQKSDAVHRFDKLFDERYAMVNRTSGRSDLALGGWRVFRDHPFGIGTGGFRYAWATLRDREGMSSYQEGAYMQAHSAWIKILSENGILGILFFGGFVVSFAVTGWKRRHDGLFLIGLFATTGLAVAFLASEFPGKGLWFLAAAVMTILRRPATNAAPAAAASSRLVGSQIRRPPETGFSQSELRIR